MFMRLWSLHPKYLDAKGIVALWREALLAKNVLEGETKGYKRHPQLERFKSYKDPLRAINGFLSCVFIESQTRGYQFDKTKIDFIEDTMLIPITCGQMEYEFEHLKKKLIIRDPEHLRKIERFDKSLLVPNFIFFLVKGGIAEWEKITAR